MVAAALGRVDAAEVWAAQPTAATHSERAHSGKSTP
jgi:hypothetical protein